MGASDMMLVSPSPKEHVLIWSVLVGRMVPYRSICLFSADLQSLDVSARLGCSWAIEVLIEAFLAVPKASEGRAGVAGPTSKKISLCIDNYWMEFR